MIVAFCVYGYSPETERLQPWLTVHEVAKILIASGWTVHLITDVEMPPTLADMRHHYVKTMRPANAREVLAIIDEIQPDRVVVLATPLNLVLSSWYKSVHCKLIAFLSYPFYTRAEFARALPHLTREELIMYGRHILVPRFLWARTLRKFYSSVIAQSHRTASRVAEAAGSGIPAYGLKAGLDLEFWTPSETAVHRQTSLTRFLYVGSAKSIRGFDVLLAAFRRLKGQAVELRILARGSTPDEVGRLRRLVDTRVGSLRAHVEIIGGWVDRERYRDELRAADAVVLPFVLVPSELPVSVIECIACGTPVIATDIDGLPDAVGSAGVIVRSGSVKALADAMRDLSATPARVDQLRTRCRDARNDMLDWSDVGRAWIQTLSS